MRHAIEGIWNSYSLSPGGSEAKASISENFDSLLANLTESSAAMLKIWIKAAFKSTTEALAETPATNKGKVKVKDFSLPRPMSPDQLYEQHVEPVMRRLSENYRQMSELRRPFNPGELERLLKIDASLDARIEKAITRLAGLKEYKQRYGIKPVLESDGQ